MASSGSEPHVKQADLLNTTSPANNLPAQGRAQTGSQRASIAPPATTQPTSQLLSSKIKGALSDITLAAVAISLPMLLLSAVLLGLVMYYNISRTLDNLSPLLGPGDAYDNSAYYVNFSATRLITVSSWASTATSFISSFFMVLISYPLARTYLLHSKSERFDRLPTPYQLKLVTSLLGGGLGALWSWAVYCCWGKRARQAPLLRWTAFSLLTVVLLG